MSPRAYELDPARLTVNALDQIVEIASFEPRADLDFGLGEARCVQLEHMDYAVRIHFIPLA